MDNKSLGERETDWDIRLRTSELRTSNCELLLDTSSNTVFYCKVGWVGCASGEYATMSIVANI